jgi:septum formation protein
MNNESLPTKLILASSSKYRKLLLHRFGIPFDCQAPEIDETARGSKTPAGLVERLAVQKAACVGARFPRAVVIGSDQVAVFGGLIIGKPGTYSAAMEQLQSFSGHVVDFLTAVAVQCHQNGFAELYTDCTRVRFRRLGLDEIGRYLEKEKPFDCAGAFKAESLGITLFESISSEDPTALIGLPLIRTAAMLRRAGLQLP